MKLVGEAVFKQYSTSLPVKFLSIKVSLSILIADNNSTSTPTPFDDLFKVDNALAVEQLLQHKIGSIELFCH